MSRSGEGLQRVGKRIVNADPTWSRDGARIAFSGHYETGARDQALWVMDAASGALPRLVAEHVGQSTWSPVDDLIAFTDFEGHLRLTAPDGTGQQTLATFAPDTEFRDLVWSRDGSMLAFTAEKQRPET
jgi:Tol biopolymer transport system component